MTRIFNVSIVLFIGVLSIIGFSCEKEDNYIHNTTFYGTMSSSNTGLPAKNFKITFIGLKSSGGLWPSYDQESSNSTTSDQEGNFSIVIKEKSEVSKYMIEVFTDKGDKVTDISGCPRWDCEFGVGGKSEMNLSVGF